MRYLAYLIAILFVLAGCSATGPTITDCAEDVVLVGQGDFDGEAYESYTCGPALDDFNKPTPTPQVITEVVTKEVEVYIEQTPSSCVRALDDADFIILGNLDIMIQVLEDFEFDENLAAEVTGRIDLYNVNKAACLAAAAESN